MSENSKQQALKPGTILKSKKLTYTIVKVLGAGSFGITYLATSKLKIGNVNNTIKFAIKEHFMQTCYRDSDGCTIHTTPSSEDDVKRSREDFLTEAKRLQKLCNQSRNIVSVNETFEANNTAYYVMEFLEGGNPPRHMAEDEAVALVCEVANAIAIVHANRMLHLDIKPGNIVIQHDDDGSSYPVLIDFGISKHFDKHGMPTSQITAKGASPGYAPQEQYAGVNEFSPKYDVYALGATLLSLISGKIPPGAFKISPDQTEIIEMIPEGISLRTRRALLHAMQPSSHLRTEDTEAFIYELTAAPVPEEADDDRDPLDIPTDMFDQVETPSGPARVPSAGQDPRVASADPGSAGSGGKVDSAGKIGSVGSAGSGGKVGSGGMSAPVPERVKSKRWPWVAALLAAVCVAVVAYLIYVPEDEAPEPTPTENTTEKADESSAPVTTPSASDNAAQAPAADEQATPDPAVPTQAVTPTKHTTYPANGSTGKKPNTNSTTSSSSSSTRPVATPTPKPTPTPASTKPVAPAKKPETSGLREMK